MTVDHPLKPNTLSALVAPNFTSRVLPVEGGVEGGGGAVTVTVTDWLAEPPGPMQTSVNVVFAGRFPVLCDPETAFVPDHPPDALHEDALVELQVSTEAVPETTELGLADKETVGPGVGGGGVTDPEECL